MDSIRTNKNRKPKKLSKTIPWKVLPYIDSDCDSDGTTGSVGAERINTEWSSTTNDFEKPIVDASPIFAEDQSDSKSPTKSSEKKSKKQEKKRNKRHKNTETLHSMLHVVVLGVLLIATGIASNQFCRNKKLQDFARDPKSIFHKYFGQLTDAYKKLNLENMELREYIQTLEASMGYSSKYNDMENGYCASIDELMKNFEDLFFDQSSDEANTECCNEETQMNDIRSININKNDSDLDAEQIIDTLASSDYVIANCDENTEDPSTISKKSKSGYVSNIRKLFEPSREEDEASTNQAPENETESQESAPTKSTIVIGPINEPSLETKLEDSTEISTTEAQECDNTIENDLTSNDLEKLEDTYYKPDHKSEIRESKRRTKVRENEGNHRIRRKSKNYSRFVNNTTM